MDRLTPIQRKLNMSRIKSKNTKPELFVFEKLESLGLSFEKHYPIHGKPDVVFIDKKIAVFINGEFWHGRKFKDVKNKLSDFWINKIGNNIKRDRRNYKLLKIDGWLIIKIWDKDLKTHTLREINKILRALRKPLLSKSDL